MTQYKVGNKIFKWIETCLEYVEDQCFYCFKDDYTYDTGLEWEDNEEYEIYIHDIMEWLYWELLDNRKIEFAGLTIETIEL